jgi:hypothetical protein
MNIEHRTLNIERPIERLFDVPAPCRIWVFRRIIGANFLSAVAGERVLIVSR